MARSLPLLSFSSLGGVIHATDIIHLLPILAAHTTVFYALAWTVLPQRSKRGDYNMPVIAAGGTTPTRGLPPSV